MRSLRRFVFTVLFAGGAVAFGMRLAVDWGTIELRTVVLAVGAIVMTLWALAGWFGRGFPDIGGPWTTMMLAAAAAVTWLGTVVFVLLARPQVTAAADAWLVAAVIAASAAWAGWSLISWQHQRRVQRARAEP